MCCVRGQCVETARQAASGPMVLASSIRYLSALADGADTLRFLADGPSLPDELLVASDEGRVLFFCGAGVSCAKANLPNFLDLARRVMLELRVLPESPAQQLLNTAATLAAIDGVGGIIAADRIFGLLEREFAVADIERAVGAALKPDEGVDLSAHRTLLA